jgi:hypothetical protein
MQLLAANNWSFNSPINAFGWGLLALVPAGIVLLYFLKLRRRPVRVPSTLLWRRSIEDLHVNSLFQRLRKNLLLFLQLLIVALVLLALAGPRIKGLTSQGERLVIAIDESASMAATDVSPSRLEEAKREARRIVGAMNSGDVAMIVAFSNSARVVATYTADKDLLRNKLDAIVATDSSTSVREALQLVAGLANPQKYLEPGEGQVASSVVPPKLFLLTDGGFADVEGFSLGTIDPKVIPIGAAPAPLVAGAAFSSGSPAAATADRSPPSNNLSILALQATRDENEAEQAQIFGRVRNHRAEPATTQAVLYRLDPAHPDQEPTLIDAVGLELPARGDQAFQFDVKLDPESNEYEVRIDADDALALDNRAFVVISTPRRARVLIVSPGNRFLADTFRTDSARLLSDLTEINADDLKSPEVANNLASGTFDLVIFDRTRPEQPPAANALYFGAWPPSVDSSQEHTMKNPVVLDWDMSHPLLQYIRDLNTIVIGEAAKIDPPAGARTLVDGDQGPLAIAIPREGFVDVAFGFALMRDRDFNTDWPLKRSFPVFVYNALRVLGRARTQNDDASTAPGAGVVLRPETDANSLSIFNAQGRKIETANRNTQGSFVATQARRTGIYQARWSDKPDDRIAFAVNLFDARESDISPRGQVPLGVTGDAADAYKIKIGHTPVDAKKFDAPAEQEWWWALTLSALSIVLVEWFVYNKRVFV